MECINSYNNISRSSVSDARLKNTELNGKSAKQITCEKLTTLLKNHHDAGIKVIRALVDFKAIRHDTWFCSGGSSQNDNLATIKTALNTVKDTQSEYPSLEDLMILVKNSSYLFQKAVPATFKEFLIQLANKDSESFREISRNNLAFLTNNNVIAAAKEKIPTQSKKAPNQAITSQKTVNNVVSAKEKSVKYEKISNQSTAIPKTIFTIKAPRHNDNKFIISTAAGTIIAEVNYSSVNNLVINITLLDKKILLHDTFLTDQNYVTYKYNDNNNPNLRHITYQYDREYPEMQFSKIATTLELLFNNTEKNPSLTPDKRLSNNNDDSNEEFDIFDLDADAELYDDINVIAHNNSSMYDELNMNIAVNHSTDTSACKPQTG